MISEIPDNDTRLLTNITDIYALHQLINEPPRTTEISATLLDVVFNNCPDNVVCSGQGHPTTVFCKISVRRSKKCLEFSID